MIALGIDIGGTSIKLAVLPDQPSAAAPIWTATSTRYSRPSLDQLASTLAAALAGLPAEVRSLRTRIGLCAPGLFDSATRTITRAVNMPAIVGADLDALIAHALPAPLAPDTRLQVCTDALAGAIDFHALHQTNGRLLAVSLGTGVGASVLDDGVPLRVTGAGPGHFGQIDVSIEDALPAPVAPDGGRGGLEGYVGLPALMARHGDQLGERLSRLTAESIEIRALARAIRIAHAVYRPDHIALLGGIGIRLRATLPALRSCVDHQLTSLARPGWTLRCGDHDHHAAAGAARLALTPD